MKSISNISRFCGGKIRIYGLAAMAIFLPISRGEAQIKDKLYELAVSSSTPEPQRTFFQRLVQNREAQAAAIVELKARRAGQAGKKSVLGSSTGYGVKQLPLNSLPGTALQVQSVNSAFGLVDVYSFPNPVRGRDKATIRVQVGLADSVDISIYDVSGKLMLHRDNFSAAQILDDGNGKGPQYTYEYAWDINGVGSGVYLYSINAKKAGKADIRVTKKIGVIK